MQSKIAKGTVEQRTLTVRASQQEDELVLVGRAVSYNTLSSDLGFREQIAPAAFSDSIENGDIRCFYNHDAGQVLGRQSAGTLKLTDSKEGLDFRCELDANSQAHRDIHASVKRGDVNECSFGFIVEDDVWDEIEENGQRFIRRTVTRGKLLEISLVSFPAYPSTSAQARAIAGVHPSNVALAAELQRIDDKFIDDQNRRTLERLGKEIRG